MACRAREAEWDDVQAYVILDDDKDMNELSDRLVQTKFITGLTAADVVKAEYLLSI